MKASLQATALRIALLVVAAGPARADYLLGPQDHIKVRLYDWRSSTADTHEWTALTGEFVVNPAGNVSLPIVGELAAANHTTSDLSSLISLRLQQTIGLAQAPVASVEVNQFRPIYLVGLVDKPGEYQYRPGLTVLQATSLAGGVQKISSLSLIGFERDMTAAQGELEALVAEKRRLEYRLNRLDAEANQAAVLEFASKPLGGPLGDLVAAEIRLFEQGQKDRASRVATLYAGRAMLQHEILTLAAKEDTIKRQQQLLQQELDAVNGLVARGLAVATRQTALEQTQAQLQSSGLDIELAKSKAQQDILHIDREVLDNSEKARSAAMTEVVEVKSRLDALRSKIETAKTLVVEAENGELIVDASMAQGALRYTITRLEASGRQSNTRANEQDPVAPGDTVKVERNGPRPSRTATSE